MTETKKNDKREIKSLRLVARGRANIDFSTECNVISENANLLTIDDKKRFFNESLAHVCARIVKYVDRLELFDDDDLLLAKITCERVARESYKAKANSTAIFLDKIDDERVFHVSYYDLETEKMIDDETKTNVRKWQYRRDERRNHFVDMLKKAINKIDASLVSIKQISTMSQEEIDLESKIKQQRVEMKANREALKLAKKARQESKA